MKFTTNDVRRQIQDGPQSTGAIDEDGFDSWYVDARQDARRQVLDWLEGNADPFDSVSHWVDQARERFELAKPAVLVQGGDE